MIEQAAHVHQRPGWFGKPRTRRLAMAAFIDRIFLGLFQSGLTFRIESERLPDDVRIVGVEYSIMRGAWLVYLESESFAPVPENEVPPEIGAPIISRIEGG